MSQENLKIQQVLPQKIDLGFVKKNKSKKRFIVISLIVFLLLVLVISTFSILTSVNIGKNNFFSSLYNYLPIEKIPLLSQIGKNDLVFIKDAIFNSSNQLQTDYNYSLALSGTENSQPMELSVSTEGTLLLNKESNREQLDGNLNLQYKSGAITFSSDNLEIGYSYMQDINKANIFYFKLNLPAELLKSLKSNSISGATLPPPGYETFDITTLNNQYIKVDIESIGNMLKNLFSAYPDFNEGLNLPSLSFLSNSSYKNFGNAIENKIQTDIPQIISNMKDSIILGKGERENINGKIGLVYNISLKSDGMDKLAEGITSSISSVTNDTSLIGSYCEYIINTINGADLYIVGSTYTKETCIQSMQKSFSSIGETLKTLFNYFELKNLKLVINPIDNKLLNVELNLGLSDSLLKQLGGVFSSVNLKLADKYTYPNTAISVNIPSEYKDLVAIVKPILENYIKKYVELKTMLKETATKSLRTSDLNSLKINLEQYYIKYKKYPKNINIVNSTIYICKDGNTVCTTSGTYESTKIFNSKGAFLGTGATSCINTTENSWAVWYLQTSKGYYYSLKGCLGGTDGGLSPELGFK